MISTHADDIAETSDLQLTYLHEGADVSQDDTGVDSQSRRYFSVQDPEGHSLPAMEYWAGSPDEAEPVHTIVRIKKFVKLVGSSECLGESEKGMLVGLRSGRKFYRIPANGWAAHSGR